MRSFAIAYKIKAYERSVILSSAYDENSYLQLKEQIEKTEIDEAKSRRLNLVILQQLEPCYQRILSLEGMEAFAKLKEFREYAELNIDSFEPDILGEYIVLCNETGQIVGEGEESELFSDEEILLMREKYYAKDKRLSDEDELMRDYGFNIFCSLYYIISFFKIREKDKDKVKKRIEKLLSYIFEDMLIDFNEKMLKKHLNIDKSLLNSNIIA